LRSGCLWQAACCSCKEHEVHCKRLIPSELRVEY
jgi:hypothetical protein